MRFEFLLYKLSGKTNRAHIGCSVCKRKKEREREREREREIGKQEEKSFYSQYIPTTNMCKIWV